MSKVVLSRQAARYYQSVDQEIAKRLAEAFQRLEQAGRPIDAKRLRGELEGLWRLRAGGLRIIYQPPNEADEIHIVKIVTRGDAY